MATIFLCSIHHFEFTVRSQTGQTCFVFSAVSGSVRFLSILLSVCKCIFVHSQLRTNV